MSLPCASLGGDSINLRLSCRWLVIFLLVPRKITKDVLHTLDSASGRKTPCSGTSINGLTKIDGTSAVAWLVTWLPGIDSKEGCAAGHKCTQLTMTGTFTTTNVAHKLYWS
jgi:hypothetical protein